MEHAEKQISQQTSMPKNKVVLILTVCIVLTAVIAGIGGYVIGGMKRNAPTPTQKTKTTSSEGSQVTPTPSFIPALSMFGYDFPPDKFTCHGFPWRFDCFFPWDLQAPFQLKNNLSCQGITLDYLHNANSQYSGLQFNITQTQKQFTLTLHGDTILEPTGGGIDHDTITPFKVVQDNYETIQAARPSKVIESDVYKGPYGDKTQSYDVLILSKTTGRGIEVWHSFGYDTFTSQYFQCK